MRDLEIRGAGNLLGGEQSGHMDAIGYELYCKVLAESMKNQGLVEDAAALRAMAGSKESPQPSRSRGCSFQTIT